MSRQVGIVLLAIGLCAVIFESTVVFLVLENGGRDGWYGFWFCFGAMLVISGVKIIRSNRFVE